MMSLKDVAIITFYDSDTDEIDSIHGHKQAELINKLIKKRNKIKKRRIRNKYKKKIDTILNG